MKFAIKFSTKTSDPGLWDKLQTQVEPVPAKGLVALLSVAVMANGKVLVTGSIEDRDDAPSSAEIYDPASGKWTEKPFPDRRSRQPHCDPPSLSFC